MKRKSIILSVSFTLCLSLVSPIYAVQETTNIETSKVENIYEEFKIEHSVNDFNVWEKYTIDEFIEYAIEEGYIEDTPEQRDATVKESLRLSLGALATLGSTVGLNTASYLLDHSLTDNPSDLDFEPSSEYAHQVAISSEYQNILATIKNTARTADKNKDSISFPGDCYFESSFDLQLAYHAADYDVYMERKTGTSNSWEGTVVFTDFYDFNYRDWEEGASRYATLAYYVQFLNNYGAICQSLGATVPYYITITIPFSFTL